MNRLNIIAWEDRLVRLSFALLALAAAYGIVVGASITMYYDITPNMGSLEDKLASVQLIPYLLAVLTSLSHLPLAVWDATRKLWKPASMRALVIIGPLIVFLGTEGLISHFLWWAPISETDRFHMLHHALVAGAPLTLGYWRLLSWGWRPSMLGPVPSLSRTAWLASGLLLVLVIMAVGIMAGLVSPIVFGVTAVLGLAGLLIMWRVGG